MRLLDPGKNGFLRSARVDSELSDPGKSVFSRSARGGIGVETLAKATFSILPGVIRG